MGMLGNWKGKIRYAGITSLLRYSNTPMLAGTKIKGANGKEQAYQAGGLWKCIM